MRTLALVLLSTMLVPAALATAQRETPRQGPAPGLVLLPSGALVRSDRLLLKWRAGARDASKQAAYARARVRLESTIPHIGWDVVMVAEDRLFEAKDELSAQAAVVRCDFSHAARVALTPDDPYYPSMWAPPRIKADRAWDITQGSASVVIAILDTGLDYSHVDLAANAWTNAGEIPANGIDDDHNGYVDDYHGYDFTYHDPEPNDVFGHGTGCAGIAAAVINNGEGVVGIGPRCALMGLKCARDDGYFFDDAVAPAFVYAADMGAKVTSNSYYGDGITPAQMDAINYAHAKGVLSVVAAGNDDRVAIYYPAGYDVSLAVGALETNDTKAWFSNYGTWVDVIAPGTSLVTTAVGNGYMGFAGTSGACPHVSGLAGLVFSQHPSFTADQVRAQIEQAAEPLIDPVIGRFTNYGVVNCERAVENRHQPTVPRAGLVWVSPIAAPRQSSVCVRGTSLGLNAGGLTIGGAPASIQSWGNERVYATTPSLGAPQGLALRSATGTLTFDAFAVLPAGSLPVYAATDLSIANNYYAGSHASGGFEELRAADGKVADVTAQYDGNAYLDVIFQKLQAPLTDRIELTYTRTYAAATGGATEYLYLYNFDSASYPYGSYEQIASFPISAGTTRTDTVVISSNAERFRAYESNVFLTINAFTNVGYASLGIDQLTIAAK
ncbi:MAG: S8 family peptidase [Planctomycetota bacterium]